MHRHIESLELLDSAVQSSSLKDPLRVMTQGKTFFILMCVLCMCVCSCACTCVCMHVCVLYTCRCICLHTEARAQPLVVFCRSCVASFWDRVSHWIGTHPVGWPGWSVSPTEPLPVTASTALGLLTCVAMSWVLFINVSSGAWNQVLLLARQALWWQPFP